MTATQIENFRKVLVQVIGLYALLMPDEEVVQMKDNFQARLDKEAVKVDAGKIEEASNWCNKCGKSKTSRHVCI